MTRECSEVKLGEVVFCEEDRKQFIHRENSKNGFDICFIRYDDSNCQKQYLGRHIISEDAAWEVVRDMSANHPYFYLMIYVVYAEDIHGQKSPVLGYRAKAFIR